MSGGLGGSIAFFLLHWPANYAGFGAFVLAGLGMIFGSLVSPARTPVPEKAGALG